MFFGLVIGFYFRKNIDEGGPIVSKRKDIMLSQEEIDEWEKRNFRL